MKKYLFTMLCACVGLIAFADCGAVPTLNNASLKGLYGTKIAVADGYYVYWDYNNSPVLRSGDVNGSFIVYNDCYSIGWESRLRMSPQGNYINYIMKLYDDFEVSLRPIVEYQDQGNGINLITVTGLKFTAGTLLASKELSDIPDNYTPPAQNCVRKRIKSFYAIPEQWLYDLSNDSTYVITGTVNDDGSIFFEDGVAFFIADEIIDVNTVTGDETVHSGYSDYTLSPLYRSIKFLNPNGVQEYVCYSGECPSVDSSRKFNMISYVKQQEFKPVGAGNGGRVSTSIDPRAIKSRLQSAATPHNLAIGSEVHLNYLPTRQEENRTLKTTIPIYISQVDEETVNVYNLFGGTSVANVMYLHDGGTMTFPVQPYDQLPEYSVYAFSDDPSTFDHSGTVTMDSISWGVTVPVDINGLKDYYYDENSLYYTNGDTFYYPGSVLRGDVNRDGEVSISDVTTLIDALLGGGCDDTSAFSLIGADCNRDGEVSIADVTFMIDYLLNGSWIQ